MLVIKSLMFRGLPMVAVLAIVTAAVADDSQVRLNSIGFLPEAKKQASVAALCDQFTVIRAGDGTTAYEGRVSGPLRNNDTGEQLYTADFSSVQQPGAYQLVVPGVGRSATFRIAKDVYNGPFCVVTRGMYLWRCGTAVSAEHDGQRFAHAACHMEDAYLDAVGGGHERKDGTGGWHDAGDYNKYVVNAGVTVGAMFQAWEQFGPKIRDVSLDIPESSNDVPDFLDELAWEIEWLLKMQAPDGSVYHKLSTRRFGGFILPEAEKTERYFTPWGSAATADFVAMTAMAARIFKPDSPELAERCRQAALKSYGFLQAHPENHRPDQRGFSTGGYGTSDGDDRLWAAAEMWQTTGEQNCLADFEKRAGTFSPKIDADWDWSNVKNLGMFTYLLSDRPGRDEELMKQITRDLLATADGLVRTAGRHGYARPLGERYYWGANGTVARQTMALHVANRLKPNPDYVSTALDALSHLFGRNYYCRSFVTGLGVNPPLHPHDRRSGADDVAPPWPGYLVGGGHPRATDWRDVQEDYRTNEIAINWNGALIYALAAFVDAPP
jgi:endoglucanase